MEHATRHAALVVEDDERCARALRNFLRRWFDVDIALDGMTALARLEAQAFDLVIVDIGLPDLDGIEVLLAARARRPTPVLAALTGTLEADLVHRVELLGATYLRKPAPLNLMYDVIDRARGRTIARPDIGLHVARRSRAWVLSPTEHNVLLWLVAAGTREEYCTRFHVKASTFDSHVKAIRAKAGVKSMELLIHRLLLDVLDGRTSPDVG